MSSDPRTGGSRVAPSSRGTARDLNAARVDEKRESLWWLAVAPSLWAAHFFSCYVAVALWCEKVVARDGLLGVTRWLVAGLTVATLVGIYATGRHAYRRHSFQNAPIPHDFDTPEDRHRFLGFAGLLLSILSAIAVVYVALPFGLVATCR